MKKSSTETRQRTDEVSIQESCQSMSKNNNSRFKAMAKETASTTWINFQYSIMFT